MRNKFKSIINKNIGDKNYKKLWEMKEVIKNLFFLTQVSFIQGLRKHVLSNIGHHFRTDKVNANHTFNDLSYLDIYEEYFAPFRSENVSLLEIGVKNGASLRTWKTYFRSGNIFGIDIDPRCKNEEEKRISVEIGSQDDMEFLRNCFGKDTKFDVIIDDGSHINNFTITSFEQLFENRLKSGGIYIIEDLQCSYSKLQTDHNILDTWPGMKFNNPSKSYDNDREDMNKFFLGKIKNLDYLEGNIRYLHFWSMTCIIKKV